MCKIMLSLLNNKLNQSVLYAVLFERHKIILFEILT
jgi:hypothetical protein